MKKLNLSPAQENELVTIENNRIVTTSLKVAERFGKRHCDVLRAIKKLECSPNFHQRNFALMVKMKELPQGGAAKCEYYVITRDGFTFLAKGFTGKVAAQFKEAYINAFNEMEETIRNSKEVEYAANLFKKQVEALNKNLKKGIFSGKRRHGVNFGPAGELRCAVFYYDDLPFEENLRNVFAQINNAYMDGYFFVYQSEESRKKPVEMRHHILRFSYESESKYGF